MLRSHLGVDSDDARKELEALVAAGKLQQIGLDNYRLTPETLTSAKHIAQQVGRSLNTVRPALAELVELGLITPTAAPTSRNRAYLLSDRS